MEDVREGPGDGLAVEGGPGLLRVRIFVEKALCLSPLFNRLYFGANLSSLPDSIRELNNLTQYLRHSLCHLISILIPFFDRLWLNTNQLTSIPDSIGQLTNLTEYGIQFVI